MSFPKYAEYVDSGVEWLGAIPRHWHSAKVWMYFELGRGRVISNEEIQDFSGEYPVYSSQTKDNGVMGKLNTFDFEGDYITWTTDGANAGTVSRRSGKFNCTNVCGTMKPLQSTMWLDFYAYALSRATSWFVRHDINPKLMNNVVSSIPIPILPFKEQTQIARFLDHETAKIDALIAEQKRLIKLLQEKRQAVISHAVTKGLDLNVPMKDSGVEWLGEVPAHWVVTPIKYLVSTPVTDGPHETPQFLEAGVTFISAEAVSKGKIEFSKAKYISEEDHLRYSRKYKPKKFDIFMVKSGATTGVVAINESDDDFNIWSPLAVIRCNESANPYFVMHAMRSRSFQESVVLNWNFGTQQNIGMRVIENLVVALPPVSEQSDIAVKLNQRIESFDVLEQDRKSTRLNS